MPPRLSPRAKIHVRATPKSARVIAAFDRLPAKIVATGCDIVARMGDDSHENATPAPGNNPNAPPKPGASPNTDQKIEVTRDQNYDRDLGVIEAITYVTRSCPSGVVIASAERALDAIKDGGPAVMKQQAYFVLMALKGWRGERARQVHRSLTRYLEGDTSKNDSPT